MKDWVKTVIWVLVGFCLISAFAGIFELFAFLQQSGLNIINLGIGDKTHTFFTANTAVAVVCAIATVAMIVVTVISLAKGGKNSKLIIALLAVVLSVSAFFIAFPFFTIEILKNNKYGALSNWGRYYYEEFAHCQQYLSATLSTFLPLLIAAGTVLGYYLFSLKKQKTAQATSADTVSSEQ